MMNFTFRPLAAACLLTAFALASPLPAQQQSDMEDIRKLLTEVHEQFLEVIQDVSEEQWNFRVGTIKHTIGEEAEHVALAEQDLQSIVIQALQEPANQEKAKTLTGKQKELYEYMMDASKAAENYRSPAKLLSKAEVLEYIRAAHGKLMGMAKADQPYAEHVYPHPSKEIGELTGVQWFYYIAYHKLRHIKQIESILAHPDFPGRQQKTD